MLDVIPTNVNAPKVNDPNSEKLNLSFQRLSKCDEHLSDKSPWMGQSKTRQIKRKLKSTNQPSVNETDAQQSTDVTSTVTRRG